VNALDERLEQAFEDEPPLGDAVDAVFRRIERLRKRRIRRVLLAGLLAVALVAAGGYGLTSVLLPAAPRHPAASQPSSAAAGPVLAVLSSISDFRIVPRAPAAGAGWRQYIALDDAGHPRGLIDVAVYTAPNGLCLPVLADKDACALPEHAAGNVEYARYGFDRDVDWQVNEAIARRLADGRTVAVMATGERGTGDAEAGRPPLTARQTAKAATEPRILDAFGPTESCNDSGPACPVLKVKVPAAG
jgi:hypothetical protein